MKQLYTIEKGMLNDPSLVSLNKLAYAMSTRDILDLQYAMITPGIHWFSLNTNQSKRMLINRFLRSLDCFNTIACLSIDTMRMPKNTRDVYHDLICGKHLIYNTLDTYFYLELEADFLWVDVTHQLQNQEWFTEFEKVLAQISKKIPVIMLVNC